MTSKALEKMKVPYKIVVEPQEYEKYASVIDSKKILITPFSNLGNGGIPVRNFVWDHATKSGADRHWILDDNIGGFRQLINKERVSLNSGICFAKIENFVDKYVNVPMAGMQYTGFMVSESSTAGGASKKPFLLNARVYSCILLSNKVGFRWRGRYNEDTDLTLRLLKSGYCTMLFNVYMCDKQATMQQKGGNTDELYKQDSSYDGRLEMALQLKRQHPDCVKVNRRWGRWQHLVDYSKWKNNKPLKIKNG